MGNTFTPKSTHLIHFFGDYQAQACCHIIEAKNGWAKIHLSIDTKPKKVKIHMDMDGNECIYPFGKFAMAPIVTAQS